jgi:curved DNA-binding protein CbpA
MNPYEVLELLPGATSDDIKSAYHRLAKQWHPDRFSGREKHEAENRFRQLAEAFTLLKDPARRQAKASNVDPARPQVQAGPPPPAAATRTAEDWFREAKEAFSEEHLERALGLVQVALRHDSKQADYHVLHGELLLQTGGDGRLAVKALEAALRLQPKHADACILLAGLYEKQAMPVRAQKLMQTARESAPNHKFFRQEARKAAAGKAPAPGIRDQVNSFFQRIFNRG